MPTDDRPAYLVQAPGRLIDAAGRLYLASSRGWSAAPAPPAPPAGAASPDGWLTATEAVCWLQRHSGHPLRVPIGVIGPREATPSQLGAARRVGVGLAEMGLTVLCGGRHGVMQAVAAGVQSAGGVSIGLLPDATPELANPHLTHVIATGLGEARNAIIARSAFCLVVIGDSYGTLSEVALGLQFGKRVFGLDGAARVDGVEQHADVATVLQALALHVIG